MEEIVVAGGRERARVTGSRSGSSSSDSRSVRPEAREAARLHARPPAGAFVVGSFQKDGVGFGDGLEPKTIKGPDVTRRGARSRAARVDDLVVLLTGPCPGVRASGARTARPSPTVHHMLADRDDLADRLPRARRLPGRLPSGGRPQERARVDGDRYPARHDPGGTGAGPRCRRLTTGSSSPSRTPRASRRDRAAPPRSLRSAWPSRQRGRETATEELARTRSTGRWAALLEGFADRGGWTSERAARYGRAAHGGPASPARGPARPGACFLRPGPDSGARRGGGRRDREFRGWPRASRTVPTDFSLLYLGSTCCPATSGRCSAREAAPCKGRRQPGRRRATGLGGGRDRGSSTAVPPRAARRPPRRCTRAASASGCQTTSSGSRRRHGRCCRTRSTSTPSRPATRRRRACRAARRRPDAGVPARARRSGSPRVDATRRPASRHRSARLRPGADSSRELGLASSRSSFAGRYAQAGRPGRLPPCGSTNSHEGDRPLPDGVDRGDGMRPACRLRGERRYRRARRRRGGCRRPPPGRPGSATSRRRRRRWRQPYRRAGRS